MFGIVYRLCPKCGGTIRIKKPKRCPYCGKKLR